MADPLPDFDFSDALQDIPGSMGDDLFSGAKFFVDNDPFLDTNFGDDIDPKFEDRLAEDYPAEKVEASEVPVLPPQQPEEPSSHPPKASNNINTQFINPQQLWVNQPANTLSIPNFNNLDIQQRSDELFTQGPIFYNQPYGNQAYAQYFPMGSRQQILQQPMGIQMTDEPIVYGQHVMSGQPIVQPPIVQQPMIQQPVFPQHRGTQISGQQIIYHRPTNPTYQVPRSPLHQPPQPTPQAVSQRPSKEKVIEHTRSSFIPTPLYRSHYSKRLPSPGTVTTRPPPKRPARNHYGELLLNDKIPRRTHGNKGNDNVEPERYYGPPTKKPDDWGPCDENGRHLFTYTDKGELAAGAFFTTRQMRHFLLGPGPGETFKAPNRQLGVKRTPKKARDGLTLWIGWPAAMANSRYPRGGESTKCRFKNCLYEHTISVGEPWVIFDERQNVDGELYNPFYNSGYCHLYCLESHFDIIHLWHLIDIRADYRSFKRESHPYFSLDYKLTGIGDELKAWWLAEYEIWAQLKSLGQRRSRTYANSLTQCLINFKLDKEPKALTKTRQKRGGADLSKHRGNPELRRKFLAYQRLGLLDEHGFPVAEAAARLQAIENGPPAQRRAGGNLQFTGNDYYPSFQPVQPMRPVYRSNQPIQGAYGPNMPVQVVGYKRGLDSAGATSEYPIVIEDMPSPKRQRSEHNSPDAYNMDFTEEFSIDSVPKETLDEIAKELRDETQIALFGPDDTKALDEILSIQGTMGNGGPVSDANEHIEEPPPTSTETNHSSESNNGFGKPEDY